MVRLTMDATRENLLGCLKAYDMWKDDYLESMSDEDLIEFGELNGAWETHKETEKN